MRAISVLAVISAHAHLPYMYGGGVGVDIFFGLSGFLITTLLLTEREQQRHISLQRFWARRALRLMPGLLEGYSAGCVEV
jgi:peptidoglycan/LPS O-acetylase OafA/YrhL